MNIYLVKTTSNAIYAVISGENTGTVSTSRMIMMRNPDLRADTGSNTFSLTHIQPGGVPETITFTVADLVVASCVPVLTNSTLLTLYPEIVEKFILGDIAAAASGSDMTDATRPSSPIEHKLYYNNTSKKFEFWNGTVWETLSYAATTVLATPASITPTAGSGQVSSAFALSAGATSYTVQASVDNFDSITATGTGSGSPIVITGLTAGVDVKTRVRAEAVGAVYSAYRTSTAVTPS